MKTFQEMSPLEIFEFVQTEAHSYLRRVTGAQQYVEVCVLSRPAIAPYWLLPIDTPASARVCKVVR